MQINMKTSQFIFLSLPWYSSTCMFFYPGKVYFIDIRKKPKDISFLLLITCVYFAFPVLKSPKNSLIYFMFCCFPIKKGNTNTLQTCFSVIQNMVSSQYILEYTTPIAQGQQKYMSITYEGT